MNKRLCAILLVVILMVLVVPDVHGANNVFFVGINDSVPMYLSAEYTPFYKGNILYVPYTVFNAGPGGVAVSYNADKGSLALFTRAKRLVYDLNAGTVSDEASKVGKVDVIYKNGMLFIPATKAFTHFGLSTAMLTSTSGCTVLRITDGSQQLENGVFIRKAETLISIILEQNSASEGNVQQEPVHDGTENTDTGGPGTIYMAFAGEAVDESTLDFLRDARISAAFFLTDAQIQENKDLVRRIYADGHTIGLTVESDVQDYTASLRQANELLDKVLYTKTVLVLLANGGQEMTDYIVFRDWGMMESVETILKSDEVQLIVCRNNAGLMIETIRRSGAYTPQLNETSLIPGASMR